MNGAQGKGYDRELAIEIFDLIEPFAGYAFNKAHSVSYALISYWTGYFKAHYPVEYMAAVLNSRLDNPGKNGQFHQRVFPLGHPGLPSRRQPLREFFTIDKGAVDKGANDTGGRATAQPRRGLRIGLAAIKTVGEGAVRPLVEERNENGAYQSIDDFCRRAGASGLNRRTLESMVKAGAFDKLASRGAMLEALTG